MMVKGLHIGRVTGNSKAGRQLNKVGVPVNHFFRDPEIEAWNKQVEERKKAKQIIQPKETK